MSNIHELTGTPVWWFGEIWVITGKNYLGDYDVIRLCIPRRVWQRSSISGKPLDKTHPHHWTPCKGDSMKTIKAQLRRSIIQTERLYPHLSEKLPNTKRFRRAKYWRRILRKFFYKNNR